MNYGMLWFDNDPKTNVNVKVERAAAYYLKKYGDSPDLCFVNPGMVDGKRRPSKSGNVTIRTNPAILPHHLWIGIKEVEK